MWLLYISILLCCSLPTLIWKVATFGEVGFSFLVQEIKFLNWLFLFCVSISLLKLFPGTSLFQLLKSSFRKLLILSKFSYFEWQWKYGSLTGCCSPTLSVCQETELCFWFLKLLEVLNVQKLTSSIDSASNEHQTLKLHIHTVVSRKTNLI